MPSFEANPNPVVEISLDGDVIYSNPAAKRIFPDLETLKFRHEFLSGLQEDLPFIGGDRGKPVMRQIKYGNSWYNQNIFYIRESGVICVCACDITDNAQVAAEMARATEEEKVRADTLKTIIENSPDIILITSMDGRILQFNKTLTDTFGFGEEIIGKQVADFVAEGDRPKIAESTQRCLQEGRVRNLEFRSFTKDGKELFVLSNISLLKDARNTPLATISTITDITERKKEEELKDEWINVISHELRSPLSAIKEGLSIVLEGLAGDIGGQQRDILCTVKNNVNRLACFINDTLDYQKLNYAKVEFNMARGSINDAIAEAVRGMDLLLTHKNLRLILELEEGLPQMEFDYNKIIQVMTNLFNNAAKFTNEGSIRVRTARLGDAVRVSVEDTGVGIEKEGIAGIFNTFGQASAGKKRHNGSGIGLMICRKIIERHGGRIWVDSELGKGTAVHFTLPLK